MHFTLMTSNCKSHFERKSIKGETFKKENKVFSRTEATRKEKGDGEQEMLLIYGNNMNTVKEI